MKTVHLIAAARPNFMKVAPLYHALKKTDWCEPVVVRGLQHSDGNMSGQFLIDMDIPNEDLINFPVGGGGHALQTANAMNAYDQVVGRYRPDAIVVPGDVNTSMACALVGAKLGIPVVHLEAGLRSFDRSMPEEINRVVIDSISNEHWAPSKDAVENLFRECRWSAKYVGNIMIDAFEMLRPQIEAVSKREGPYAVVTLHRPSNVDDGARMAELWDEITELSNDLPVIFPVHPRARKQFSFGQPANVKLCAPMPYTEFMALVKNATIVITDSGGVQEETSYLGVPCLTLRKNTERPITVTHGTNELISPAQIVPSVLRALRGEWKKGGPIPLWDGHTAERCVASLKNFMGV